MKRAFLSIFRMFEYIGLFFVSITFIYFTAAVTFTLIPVNNDYKRESKGVEIFILSSDIHTEFVLPTHNETFNWQNYIVFPDSVKDHSKYSYVSFGWGDEDFYMNTPTWDDLDWKVALRSLFLPTSSVMHVTFFQYRFSNRDNVKKIILSKENYQKLIDFILNSFEKRDDNFIELPGKGYTKTDRFYRAKGKYTFIYTCNNWTNQGLKKAGIKTSLWAPFVESVNYHLD